MKILHGEGYRFSADLVAGLVDIVRHRGRVAQPSCYRVQLQLLLCWWHLAQEYRLADTPSTSPINDMRFVRATFRDAERAARFEEFMTYLDRFGFLVGTDLRLRRIDR